MLICGHSNNQLKNIVLAPAKFSAANYLTKKQIVTARPAELSQQGFGAVSPPPPQTGFQQKQFQHTLGPMIRRIFYTLHRFMK